jgi:hypothetical protein
MSTFACGLAMIRSAYGFLRAKYIDALRFSFQVRWIDAAVIVTSMVEVPIYGNWTNEQGISDAVSKSVISETRQPESRTAARQITTEPNPAVVDSIDIHFAPETINVGFTKFVPHMLRISSDQAEPCDGNRLQARATWAAVETERGDAERNPRCDSPLSWESNHERTAEMTVPF